MLFVLGLGLAMPAVMERGFRGDSRKEGDTRRIIWFNP